ncbi:MAG: hypothetical protein ACYCW6_27240 [Candidatus Xenobia bacterium]
MSGIRSEIRPDRLVVLAVPLAALPQTQPVPGTWYRHPSTVQRVGQTIMVCGRG